MTATTGASRHLLLWVDPRAGIATEAIQRNGGGWLLRCCDGAIHDGPCNLDLPEGTDPGALAQWASGQLGYPVTVTRTRSPRRWLPYQLRDCGETTVYDVTAP